ncbi:ATP-grasp domain-containing protein [Kitasatospora sp. NPDC059646]|uniref:ATP-grasp domain-containing protein n=1 Tax=Kitasatospora sp. NPDC059646 TaxID=3346893 RepID=UPI0036A7F24A
MKRVLLVNTSGDVAARRLQDRTDLRLSVITSPNYRGFYRPETDVTYVENVEDLTQVRLAALEIRRRNAFEHVVSPSEYSLQAAGYVRSYFGIPGIGYEAANAFSNKYVMKQKLAAAGLPVARFRLLGSFEDAADAARELGWPVVVKPALGGGSEDIFAVRDAAHLAELASSERTASLRNSPYPMIAEEFVDIGTEYHCDGAVVDGEVRFASVSKYFTPLLQAVGDLVGSYTVPLDDPLAKEIRELHDAAVAALGLTGGVTHLEVFETAGGLLIGEVSCRPGGGGIADLVAHHHGVDPWHVLIETSLGESPAVDVRTVDGCSAVYFLPRPQGTIVELSTAEELRALPGVTHVEVRAKVGEVETGAVHSATQTGFVLLNAPTEAEVAAHVAALTRAYRIRTERA